jgi:chromate transport protein ChrA
MPLSCILEFKRHHDYELRRTFMVDWKKLDADDWSCVIGGPIGSIIGSFVGYSYAGIVGAIVGIPVGALIGCLAWTIIWATFP